MDGPALDNCSLIAIPRTTTVRNACLSVLLSNLPFANIDPSVVQQNGAQNPTHVLIKFEWIIYQAYPNNFPTLSFPKLLFSKDFHNDANNLPTMDQKSREQICRDLTISRAMCC